MVFYGFLNWYLGIGEAPFLACSKQSRNPRLFYHSHTIPLLEQGGGIHCMTFPFRASHESPFLLGWEELNQKIKALTKSSPQAGTDMMRQPIMTHTQKIAFLEAFNKFKNWALSVYRLRSDYFNQEKRSELISQVFLVHQSASQTWGWKNDDPVFNHDEYWLELLTLSWVSLTNEVTRAVVQSSFLSVYTHYRFLKQLADSKKTVPNSPYQLFSQGIALNLEPFLLCFIVFMQTQGTLAGKKFIPQLQQAISKKNVGTLLNGHDVLRKQLLDFSESVHQGGGSTAEEMAHHRLIFVSPQEAQRRGYQIIWNGLIVRLMPLTPDPSQKKVASLSPDKNRRNADKHRKKGKRRSPRAFSQRSIQAHRFLRSGRFKSNCFQPRRSLWQKTPRIGLGLRISRVVSPRPMFLLRV